jgi:hypothetical protein
MPVIKMIQILESQPEKIIWTKMAKLICSEETSQSKKNPGLTKNSGSSPGKLFLISAFQAKAH